MLSPVIKVNEDKCNNCHMCISVCPVKYCINGSGEKVSINHDLCIGCSKCIEACPQQAREIIDDTDSAFAALKAGERIIAIAAPALISSFDRNYRNLIGWIKQQGAAAVFDVSFGAELTVKSYLDYITREKPKMVIAQPCPAIVSYIEIYKPELIKMLAPADSPMLHTIKMVKTFYPEYRNHRVLVLSPCIAKRREFDDTGLADFNVTIAELTRLLKQRGVDLSSIRPQDFDNPPPERAALFSSPGGLMKTVLREKPDIEDRIRKIEGPSEIYNYLDTLPESLRKGTNPLIVDCLNCVKGCNGGPGTLNKDMPIDDLEYIIRSRTEKLKKNYRSGITQKTSLSKINNTLDKFWSEDMYKREYKDRSGNFIFRLPASGELDTIYRKLLKKSEEDFLNCAACGYNSCEKMAIAIFNGLNKPENCHHYRQKMVEIEKNRIDTLNSTLKDRISSCEVLITDITDSLETVNLNMDEQSSSITTSTSSIESLLDSLQTISGSFSEQGLKLEELITNARAGGKELKTNSDDIGRLTDDINSIGQMVGVIDDISQRTNLLSMNAAIEAAHAGNSGKGFAVVASEIKKLAENTAAKANEVSASLDGIITDTRSAGGSFKNTSVMLLDIISRLYELTEVMNSLLLDVNNMNDGSTAIKDSLNILRNDNVKVVDSTSAIRTRILRLHQNMVEMIKAASDDAETPETVQP